MKHRVIFLPFLVLSLVCSGCVGPIRSLYPPLEGEVTRTVYVVSEGWHTGIAVERADIPLGTWPENNHFPNARWIEVGWGDQAYYLADEPSLWVTCKAAFWPTPSALHIVGLKGSVETSLPTHKIIAVNLSANGFERLCQFMHNSYARNAHGAPMSLGLDRYGDGRFYRAIGKFYLPKSCNTWTASALRSAGCPITPAYASTAGNILLQAGKFGRRIR